MLWAIAVALIIGWLLGMAMDFGSGWVIHSLYAVAVVILVVSVNREVSIYRGLRQMARSRNFRRAEPRSAG
jgi:hypothetical protein